MFKNACRMAKTSSKLLLRNKAFFVVGILIPIMATLLINMWSGMATVEIQDTVYELTDMDEQVAYGVDFNRYPVKIYDKANNEDTREICENINAAGMFQVFRVAADTYDDETINESIRNTTLNDKIGAIVILADNENDIKLYSVGEDERFELFKNTLEFVVMNHTNVTADNHITYVTVGADDAVDYYQTRDFSYCLAIASMAFIFGGVLVLSTVITEKNDNVYSRLMMTSATKGSYLLSKVMLAVAFALIQSVIMSISFTFFVKSNIGISPWQFFIVLFLEGLIFSLVSLCSGLFINSVAASSLLAFTIWSMSALLAGTYFDISNASDLYKKIALIMPERWAMLAVTRFVNGDNSGYSLILCATAAFLVIIFVVSIIGLKLSDDE